MKLTRQERKSIMEIMDKFSAVHGEIIELEQTLQSLENKRTSLLQALKDIRAEEDTIVKRLQSKYGSETSLNLETLELIKE